eukprot:CAMPEP_0172467612 /NCGR_PEP_ID=MMETSP1065-20121228/59410_1 /TAXON_ID=265537 /ORGANISM="Amphiprora paludosa, Strain CCMP125" /LENGTH=60 /DNA_ID=CAMNT_0013224807 /DNA_START=65 /DNA_END=244 /DNA_ORIENTATION=+
MSIDTKKKGSDQVNMAKEKQDFRVYDGSNSRVEEHYKNMRMYQTVAFYRKMEHKYTFENG